MIRRFITGLFLTALGLAAIAATAVYFFSERLLPPVAERLIVSDPVEHADLVIGLGGENVRRKEAVRLFKDGIADRILFTGFEIDRDDYRRYGIADGRYVYPVELLTNTYEEAEFARALAAKDGLRSVIVVTSFYHTRRAAYIFRKLLEPAGVKVIVVPVFNSKLKPDEWWRNRYLRKAVLAEWIGLAFYMLEY